MALSSSSTLHSIFVGLKYTVIISTLFRLSLCARLRTSSSWNRSILFVKMMSTSFTFRLSPPLSVNTWMLRKQSWGFQSINLLVKLHLTINFLALEGNKPVNSKAMLNHLAVSTNCNLFFYFDKNVKKTREQRMSSFSKFIYIKNCVVANNSNNKVILAVPIYQSLWTRIYEYVPSPPSNIHIPRPLIKMLSSVQRNKFRIFCTSTYCSL